MWWNVRSVAAEKIIILNWNRGKTSDDDIFINFVVYCLRFIASLVEEYVRSYCCCQHLISFQLKNSNVFGADKGWLGAVYPTINVIGRAFRLIACKWFVNLKSRFVRSFWAQNEGKNPSKTISIEILFLAGVRSAHQLMFSVCSVRAWLTSIHNIVHSRSRTP